LSIFRHVHPTNSFVTNHDPVNLRARSQDKLSSPRLQPHPHPENVPLLRRSHHQPSPSYPSLLILIPPYETHQPRVKQYSTVRYCVPLLPPSQLVHSPLSLFVRFSRRPNPSPPPAVPIRALPPPSQNKKHTSHPSIPPPALDHASFPDIITLNLQAEPDAL
jgi:hypothetical protein